MKHRIVVTGAAGILGQAVASYLHATGFAVVGLDLATEAPFPGQFLGSVDLTKEDSTHAAFTAIGRDGPIAGLVNIAGGFRWETIEEGTVESWDLLYRMNVNTALISSKAALPFFAPTGGSIVNIGAAATLKAGFGMGAYTASKSGVARLTEALAEEMKDRDIRVNAVLPSIIDTPANRAEMGDTDVNRWVCPEALAKVIGFLLSPESAAITGACIPVTGRV